jgi:hypothetical protein
MCARCCGSKKGCGVVLLLLSVILAARPAHVLSKDVEGINRCHSNVGNPLIFDGEAFELVQVVVVHRHGDRTPISRNAGAFTETLELKEFWKSRVSASKDIERTGRMNTDSTSTHLSTNFTEGKYVFPNGHLTRLGANQLRRVGAQLRERYIGDLDFLPHTLPSDHNGTAVYARSTRYPRTIQSVQNLLLGLYPDDAREERSEIEISSQVKGDDYMTGMSEKRCPKIRQLVADADARQQMPHNYTQLLRRLSAIVDVVKSEGGDKEDTKEDEATRREKGGVVGGGGSALIDTWMHLMDIGTCHVAHRVTPPLNLTPADIEAVQQYNSWVWDDRFTRFTRELNVLALSY